MSAARAALVLAVVVLAVVVLVGCGGGSVPPPASAGNTENLAVPPAIANLPLVDQKGRQITLAELRGRIVVVAPFLTLCQEICPMTTANLVQVDRDLSADHAAGSVEIVEVSVDPGRDSPARLAAYAQMTRASHELVTETPAVLARLARFFGWYYGQVAEGSPPATDWWTGRALTYDVTHSDGFNVIDASGHERFATGADPSFRGELPPRLAAYLSAQGRQNLAHPAAGAWTPTTVLHIVGWLLHRSLPA